VGAVKKIFMGRKTKAAQPRSRASAARLAEMIEEATVDAYDESELATGWYTMFESHLHLPFETNVLGARVRVVAIEQRDGNQIVAVCKRGKETLRVGIADLPLPSPRPEGAAWIEAYRRWLRGR
jgi:hypothetical protein